MGHQKWNKNQASRAEAWIATHGLQDFGGATLPVYCAYMDISDQTHYNWIAEHLEYLEAIQRGKARYKSTLREEAVTGLMELVKGYTAKETKTEYVSDANGDPLLNKQVVVEKHIPRSTGAIIFALTNLDPDNWKNRQENQTKLDAEGISVIIGAGGGVPARTTEEPTE